MRRSVIADESAKAWREEAPSGGAPLDEGSRSGARARPEHWMMRELAKCAGQRVRTGSRRGRGGGTPGKIEAGKRPGIAASVLFIAQSGRVYHLENKLLRSDKVVRFMRCEG